MCRHASLWQLHLDSPRGLFNDHRTGFPLKVPAPIYTTLTIAYLAEPFLSGLFSTLICNLNVCKCEGGGDASRFPVFDLQLENVLDRIFNSPQFLCGWHDWDMWQSNWLQSTIICVLEPSGSSHHSWVSACPWTMWAVEEVPAWAPYLWLSSKRRGPPFPVPLRSPHRDFDKCATETKTLSGVLINWQQTLLSH